MKHGEYRYTVTTYNIKLQHLFFSNKIHTKKKSQMLEKRI